MRRAAEAERGPAPTSNVTPVDTTNATNATNAADVVDDRRPLVITQDSYEGPNSTPTAANDGRIILLYNQECSVCRSVSSWVIGSDEPTNGGRQAIDERPIGHDPDELAAIHPDIDIWDAYEKVHVVMPDGTLKEGGEAVAEVLKALPKTAWMGALLDFSIGGVRPFQKILDAGYYVLDRLRPALGCESCGKPVPWWGKPVAWIYNLVKGKSDVIPPADQSGPADQ